MSEPFPEPGPPLSPDELRRLDEMVRQAGNLPEFADEAIATMTSVHAQWYRGWQAAGVPENRAAEWAAIMIRAMFSQSQ